MSGTVGICAQDTGRFTAFTHSLLGLEPPPDTTFMWEIGSNFVGGRNRLVERMTGDFLFFMDDDHSFQGTLLKSLLRHNVDVVAPLCLMRQEPFYPVAMQDEARSIDLTAVPTEGLIEVHAIGTAGMLIRRKVFDLLEPPYFRLGDDVSEDFLFCQRLREAGVKIHCDLGNRLGHLTISTVYPSVTTEGKWCVGFVIADTFPIQVGLQP